MWKGYWGNNQDKSYIQVQFYFDFYNGSGEKAGETVANVSNLELYLIYLFNTSVRLDGVESYELAEVVIIE